MRMRTIRRLRVLGTLAVAGALVLSGGPAIAGGSSTHTPRAYTCAGGEIPSGTYASITVKGECSVPADAVIRVVGNVSVRAGASLDAQRAPSTITVGHNVTAASGSSLGLGCQPPSFTGNSAHACYGNEDAPEVRSFITVKGNVTAVGASLVLLNGITVKGNISLLGGGGPIPWSVKNNEIGRNLTVIGLTTEWFGVLFNSIRGSATLLHITLDRQSPGSFRGRLRRSQHDRAQPHLHGTDLGRDRLLQRRRPPRDRSVRIPGLTSLALRASATPAPSFHRCGRRTDRAEVREWARCGAVPEGL